MWRCRPGAIGVVAAAALVALTSLVTSSGSVSACSCEEWFPSVADSIGEVDIAFVGRLESTEAIDPSGLDAGIEYSDVRYELIVEHAVKGVEDGDRVVMFGDVGGGSSCGTSELSPGLERYAILSSESSGRFVADSTPPCSSVPSVEELFAVDLTLPETAPGPVSAVVVGRVGEAELISYGVDGRPVGYADLPWRVGQPAVCPGSERLVQLEQDEITEQTTLTSRDVATLTVIGRVDISGADRPAGWTPYLDDFLVDSAALDCRSADGGEVRALLQWENSDREETVVFAARPDGEVVFTSLGQLSRARLDTSTVGVVGVRAGELVRYSGDGEADERILAQLLNEPDEVDFGAVFVEPDDVGGWWVGLGPIENDYGIASVLRLLAYVGAGGSVERWPVESDVDYIDSVVFVGERLLAPGIEILLPAAGSSSTGVTVAVENTEFSSLSLRLDDGRTVRVSWDDGRQRIELIGADDVATTLAHLLELRFAVATPGGPIADPGEITRELAPPPIDSKWITSNGTPATDRFDTVSAESATSAPTEPSDEGAVTTEQVVHDDAPHSDSEGLVASQSSRTGVVVAVSALGLLVAVLVVVWRRRRSVSSE